MGIKLKKCQLDTLKEILQQFYFFDTGITVTSVSQTPMYDISYSTRDGMDRTGNHIIMFDSMRETLYSNIRKKYRVSINNNVVSLFNDTKKVRTIVGSSEFDALLIGAYYAMFDKDKKDESMVKSERKELISTDKRYLTRSGNKVRVLTTDFKHHSFPVVALAELPNKHYGEETLLMLDEYGRVNSTGDEANDDDLILQWAPEKGDMCWFRANGSPTIIWGEFIGNKNGKFGCKFSLPNILNKEDILFFDYIALADNVSDIHFLKSSDIW